MAFCLLSVNRKQWLKQCNYSFHQSALLTGQILRHQYGISVAESQTFFRAKRPQWRSARGNGCFRQLKLGGNNGFTLLIDPQVESFHGLKATSRICPTTTKQQTYGNWRHFAKGLTKRKMRPQKGALGKWRSWRKWRIGRNAHRLFSHLLSYIPQTHGKFPLDSPFSSNLPLYKECILTFEYIRQPLGKFHHIFHFHQGSI